MKTALSAALAACYFAAGMETLTGVLADYAAFRG